MKIWDLLEHFSPSENWGDYTKISGKLLFTIDAVRKFIKLPIKLSSPAYATSGHSSDSQHGKGNALDAYIIKGFFTKYEALNQFIKGLEAMQINSYALGYYPWWNDKENVGIHFDVRECSLPLWWISPRPGEYDYYVSKTAFLDAVKFYNGGS